jgi:excisionase family DNA binding protein
MVAVVAITAMPSTISREPAGSANNDMAQLRDALSGGSRATRSGIHRIALTDGAYLLLVKIVEDLAGGAHAAAMTTKQASDFLGVSRQFLVRLLDSGQIPFHRAGTYRRVYLRDLVSFRDARDKRRHTAIRQMARDAVAEGLYDDF